MKQRPLDIGVWGARGIPSTYSGYETFLTAFLPELARRGHNVTMYCRTNQVPHQDSYEGVRLVHLPAPTSKQLGTLTHGLLAGARARVAAHDVVLVVNVANAIYCLLARLTGQRTVLNTDGQEWLRGKWGLLARSFFKMSARLARRSSCALIADCVAMREVYRAEFAADSTVIPYPWAKLPPAASSDAVLSSVGLKRREYYIAAGRLNPENNIHEIARAYVQAEVDTPLVLLGVANYDSPVERDLRDLARANPGIRLLGHVADRSAFSTLLRESKAYIHGHSVGGLNPSLVEAMGSGAVVVVLGTSFNREAVGDAGIVFDDFTADLPRKIRSLDHEDSRADLRERAQRRVETLFRMDDVVHAHEELLRLVAESRPWSATVIPTPWSTASDRSE